jgi:hypothetical protein
LGYGVVHSSITLTVSVYETFVAIIVMFDTASSRALEDYTGISFYGFKLATIDVLSLYLEALRLQFVRKLLEVVGMILLVLISANKIDGCFFTVLRNAALNEDILEDALR